MVKLEQGSSDFHLQKNHGGSYGNADSESVVLGGKLGLPSGAHAASPRTTPATPASEGVERPRFCSLTSLELLLEICSKKQVIGHTANYFFLFYAGLLTHSIAWLHEFYCALKTLELIPKNHLLSRSKDLLPLRIFQLRAPGWLRS